MRHLERLTDMLTLHFVSYFPGADVFMSLHRSTITLTPIMSIATVLMQNKSQFKFQTLTRTD